MTAAVATAATATGHATAAAATAPRRVAYVMSRFPKLTETFVLDEILALERRGVVVEVFPLWREHAALVHPEARAVVDRAHFLPTLDPGVARDNLRTLGSQPRAYLACLGRLIWSNRTSPRYLAGALAIFPKAVAFARRMRALGVEHVHAHFASHPAAAAFVVGRLAGIPWSFTAHGSDLHREQAMLREKVAEARFVVAISDYNCRFILEHAAPADADRVHVVHCGVDLSGPPTAPPPRAPGAPLEVVCVGTLHAVKGQRTLIEAAGRLAATGRSVRIHFVGDGEDRRALEALAETHGVADRVVFHGALDRAGVARVRATAHVAAAPSVPTRDGRREGIPVVLMEAAAAGLPLVGSRLSGIPEIVVDGESGLLVEPGDAADLADVLARLDDDAALRARLGAGARHRVEAAFRLEANVERLASLFAGAGASA